MAYTLTVLRFFQYFTKCLRICIFLSILWCTVEGRRITVKNCGTRNLPMARIVGGTEAQRGDYPWMVTVHEKRNDFDHVCGGAIINEHWIVTAAHCIDYPDLPWRYAIFAGLHRLSEKTHRRVKRHRISKIIVHENYDNHTFFNDIALLRTKFRMDIKKSRGYMNGVCLPETKKDPTGLAIVTGWGYTMEDGENSDILKAVKVRIVDRRSCNEAYDEDPDDDEDEVIDTMICAGEPGKDSCQNDSGGPMVQNRNGVYTLVGVVSHGTGCGDSHPGVYTKVSSYMEWMERNMH